MDYQQIPTPVSVILHRGLFHRFRTRYVYDFEWALTHRPESHEFEYDFFFERRPVQFDLEFYTDEPLHVERLAYHHGGQVKFVPFAVETARQGDGIQLKVTPLSILPANKVVVRMSRDASMQAQFKVKILGKNPHDVSIVRNVHELAAQGQFAAAIDGLLTYRRIVPDNPLISSWLSDWYRQLGKLDEAEEHAVHAGLHGNFDVCAEKYRSVQQERPPREIAEIRRLQQEARDWSVGAHHGLVIIDQRQHYALDLGKWHLRQKRQLIEIRRAAAARMLSELHFDFSATRELVLFTALRVVHDNDESEEVPLEHFTIVDHESRNILITVEDEKAGHWILPDLSPGDVIDWSYHLLCQNHDIEGAPHVFVHSSLCDSQFPTYQARSRFVTAERQPIRFSVRNYDLEPKQTRADGKAITVFDADHFVPTRRTGFMFENSYLNPAIVCVTDGIGWSDVARQAILTNFGADPIEDELPEPLHSFVADTDQVAGALEYAYYWVRDQIKYASVRSGIEHIGETGRASQIVAAGVGNCNDKSYLLSLICKQLGTPCQFVVISTKNGTLVGDAPADQFDHVFVRAQLGGEWIYLDAANPLAPFGSAPAWCQGMEALVLDEPGSIITIPVDDPTRNALVVSETFDDCRDGHIHGRFGLRAFGHAARLTDERWKGLSLSLDDQQQAAQESLREFLPSAIVRSWQRESDTSISSQFRISGRHSRGPLVALGKNRRVVSALDWTVPFLPLSYWRTLQIDRLFVVDFPLEISIDVEFAGDLRRRVDDLSRIDDSDDPVARITEELVEQETGVRLRRRIVFKSKFLRGDDVRLVPAGFERIEKALRLVVSFDDADGGGP